MLPRGKHPDAGKALPLRNIPYHLPACPFTEKRHANIALPRHPPDCAIAFHYTAQLTGNSIMRCIVPGSMEPLLQWHMLVEM